MHELGIASDMWAVAKSHARANNVKRITKITIVIGEASGFAIDFLRHSLKDHVLPGTIGENAELEFIPVQLEARCNVCAARITKDTIQTLSCPQCGSADIAVTAGKESYVQSIEGE
jgi:hydrogenase nickel incorporation protein HypA/HybF